MKMGFPVYEKGNRPTACMGYATFTVFPQTIFPLNEPTYQPTHPLTHSPALPGVEGASGRVSPSHSMPVGTGQCEIDNLCSILALTHLPPRRILD